MKGHGSPGGQLTVLPVALGLTAPFASMLVARLGSRAVTSAGMVITAAGMAGLAALHAQSSLLLASLVVAGIGLGLFHAGEQHSDHGGCPPRSCRFGGQAS